MFVGLNCNQANYAPHWSGFPGVRVVRVFSGPGEGILAWNHPRVAGVARGAAVHMSFKDWDRDSAAARAVEAWLHTMPQVLLAGPPLLAPHPYSALLTYLHEPENNGVPVVEYQRRYRLLYDTVRAHPNGHLVAVVPIQTLQWTMAVSGPGTPKGDGNVFAWWAGTGDYAGVDCYANSWDGDYPVPAGFLQPAFRLATGVGRPLWVPELGAVKLGMDTDGTKRAAWIRATVKALRGNGCAAVSWWCETGAGGKDFHLSDQPSASAWRDALAGRI